MCKQVDVEKPVPEESWGRWTAPAKHLDFIGRIYMLLMRCMIFREKQLWSISSLRLLLCQAAILLA